jgi:pyridoxine 5-phosphate synthase
MTTTASLLSAQPHAWLPTALSVNVNKVALVRNTRHLGIPSVTRAAQQCLEAGAQGITIHPRPDGAISAATTCSSWQQLMQDWPAARVQHRRQSLPQPDGDRAPGAPHQATFVPDSEGQFTSDHGWRFRRTPSGCAR